MDIGLLLVVFHCNVVLRTDLTLGEPKSETTV